MSVRKPMIDQKSSDDIDHLLDQVEKKYFKSPEAAKLAQTLAKDCECTKKQETNWEEVDEILKDFVFEDTNPFGKHKNNSWIRGDYNPAPAAAPEKSSDSSGGSGSAEKKNDVYQKCFSVILAGSFELMGYSELGREKPCDNLKCLRCDFRVLYFDNFAWDPSTDYLFLRNNIPDFQKLAVKLQKKKGWRAYACQCKHLSINKITLIGAKPEVKWICGRHKI